MMRKKSSFPPLPVSRLAVFAVALAGGLRAGTQTPDPALEQGLRRLEEGRTTLDDKPLAAAQDYFRRLTEQHPENAVYFYELGRVNFYRREAVDLAIANVEQSLKLNEKSA